MPAGRPSIGNLDEQEFRNLVIALEGNGVAIAKELGVTPSAVSIRLRTKHSDWWTEYKKEKEKKNALLRELKIDAFRKVVTKHKGNVEKIAKELKLKTATVTMKLSSSDHKAWWEEHKNKLAKKDKQARAPREDRTETLTKLVIAVQNKDCLNTVFENSCRPERLCGLCELKEERNHYKRTLASIVATIEKA